MKRAATERSPQDKAASAKAKFEKRQKRRDTAKEIVAPLKEIYLETGLDRIDENASRTINAQICEEADFRKVPKPIKVS